MRKWYLRSALHCSFIPHEIYSMRTTYCSEPLLFLVDSLSAGVHKKLSFESRNKSENLRNLDIFIIFGFLIYILCNEQRVGLDFDSITKISSSQPSSYKHRKHINFKPSLWSNSYANTGNKSFWQKHSATALSVIELPNQTSLLFMVHR